MSVTQWIVANPPILLKILPKPRSRLPLPSTAIRVRLFYANIIPVRDDGMLDDNTAQTLHSRHRRRFCGHICNFRYVKMCGANNLLHTPMFAIAMRKSRVCNDYKR